ncbi:MAG: hypothetical protein JRM82_01075 [Nitrososphaerota archaeon]|nr:hypothetical protein [Nitrososphaerota archaeon]
MNPEGRGRPKEKEEVKTVSLYFSRPKRETLSNSGNASEYVERAIETSQAVEKQGV